MYYYAFNIGDYASHTHHLDEMEDLAYRRLLDLYYLHEQPLSVDSTVVAKKIGMRNRPEVVQSVLEEFFELGPNGWINTRADKEIKHFHSKIEQASRAGKASAERRSNARSTDVQPTNNHKPINNNQEPDLTGTNVPVCPADAEPDAASKLPGCNHKGVVDLYHQLLPTLPKVEVWNETRSGYLRSRWKEIAVDMRKSKGSVTSQMMMDWWAEFFGYVGRSPFLTGKTNPVKDKPPFLADLEWIIRPTNFAKIVEGKYHRS